MSFRLARSLRRPPAALLVLCVLALCVVAMTAFWLWLCDRHGLEATLQASFPRTKITSISCKTPVGGLCEVIAGRNVFYATQDGRFIVIGSMLDLRKKLDLTNERLKQLAAVDVATGVLEAPGGAQQASAPTALPVRLKVTLPLANAIVHNPGAPIRLTVFSDYNCGYCRTLFTELNADSGVEVTEYPIAILGDDSAEKARLVLCSPDRASASHAVFTGGPLQAAQDCSAAAAAVAANTRFAKANGISATPTFVRADGMVSQGYLAPLALKAFGESKS